MIFNQTDWRESAIKLASRITAPIPRIRGLGLVIGKVADQFRNWDVLVERPVFGRRMLLNPSDQIGNFLLFAPNYYDRKERSFMAKTVKSGDLVVDVGANIGAYSLILADLVGPTGQVIAIEAEPQNASMLRRNAARNGLSWIDVKETGVSSNVEVLDLHINDSGNAGAHSFLVASSPSKMVRQIHCVPLAGLLPVRLAPRFMKLDIEGFEFRVLDRYFTDVAEQFWPHFIQIEDVAAHRERSAMDLCLSLGYQTIHRFGPNILLAHPTSELP